MPQLSEVMELAELESQAGVQVMQADSARAVADAVARSGRTWVWVEGFPSAGKTTFCFRLARELGWAPLDLDHLSHGRSIESSFFADFMDEERLSAELGSAEHRRHRVISGVCLRDVMERLGAIEPAFAIYIARVGPPSGSTVIWQDWLNMEQPLGDDEWLRRDVNRYHIDRRPERLADLVLLRRE